MPNETRNEETTIHLLETTGFQKFPVSDNKYSERVNRINQLSSVNWLLIVMFVIERDADNNAL